MSSFAFAQLTPGGVPLGAGQGIGIGGQHWNTRPQFVVDTTVQLSWIGGPAVTSHTFWPTEPDSHDAPYRYVQAGADLAPDAETATDSGFFNRTGLTIPAGAYFWAVGSDEVPAPGPSGFDGGFDGGFG